MLLPEVWPTNGAGTPSAPGERIAWLGEEPTSESVKSSFPLSFSITNSGFIEITQQQSYSWIPTHESWP